MNITHLLYCSEIIKYQSINKAARVLFVTPSTLSSALNSVEDELGYKIVTRSRQGVKPTREGEAFFNDVQLILNIQNRWKNVTSIDTIAKVKLPLTVIPTIYHSVLPTLVSHFLSSFPQISLVTEESDIITLDKHLIDGTLKLAIRSCTKGELENLKIFVDNLDLDFTHLYTDMCCIVMNKNHPLASKENIAIKDLKHYPGIALSHPSSIRFEFSNLYPHDNVLYLNNISYILQFLLLHKNYFSFLYTLVNKSIYFSNDQLQYRPILDHPLPLDIILIHPKKDLITKEEDLLANFIIEFFAKLK